MGIERLFEMRQYYDLLGTKLESKPITGEYIEQRGKVWFYINIDKNLIIADQHLIVNGKYVCIPKSKAGRIGKVVLTKKPFKKPKKKKTTKKPTK